MAMRTVSNRSPADLAEKLEWLMERLTFEALADVKARRTHDHAEIEAWAASLDAPKRKARR